MFTIHPIGHVGSALQAPEDAPKQGFEGSPPARLRFQPEYEEGLRGIEVGQRLLVLTWLDLADRSKLSVHPRGDEARPLRGVFSTRSPSRPNPIGIHPVRVTAVVSPRELEVADLEAIDGTPIIDVKPLLREGREG